MRACGANGQLVSVAENEFWGAVPTLVVGMWLWLAATLMPTTSVGMAPDFPQQKLIRISYPAFALRITNDAPRILRPY